MPPPLRNGAWMNVAYKGNADQELSWFAGTLSLPLASANTERAARAIVDAARHGYAETMVSTLSWLQSRFYSLFPETTISLAAAADQYLLPACPPGAGEAPAVSAAEILVSTEDPKVQKVARHGQSDAARYLQPLASMINGNGRKPN
jgi:hypothetical protein